MDHRRNNAQDVLRCHLCETPAPPMYCDICNLNLCKPCVGEHLSDESTEHRVVPFRKRGSTLYCSKHSTKLCHLHCEQCDIPICVQCVSSGEHIGHKQNDILKFLENKNEALLKNLKELENLIYPKYQEIASYISVQKSDLRKNSKKLKTALDKQGETLHREIDNAIKKLKNDVDELESKDLVVLDKQDYEIKHNISEITRIIADVKKLLDSNDASRFSSYKFSISKYRRIPPKVTVSLTSLSSQKINEKQIYQQFGSLSAVNESQENYTSSFGSPPSASSVSSNIEGGCTEKEKQRLLDQIGRLTAQVYAGEEAINYREEKLKKVEEENKKIKEELNNAVHMMIAQLIDDKKNLSEKCEMLVKELKTVDKKYQDKIKTMDEKHAMDIQKIKDMHEAAEKLRRERWIQDKTKKIKEMTVQGLEPEIQRLIAKHKNEIKQIKQIHDAEILESDDRAAQRYVRMTEELRDQLAKEKEAACARERELANQRYEKELQNEEAYQQQMRRLYQEVQEEKERVAQQASRQRTELDKLQRQLEDSHALALAAMKSEFERYNIEIRESKERLAVEENYMKKQATRMLHEERELNDQVRRDRDKEIELVISRLEEDATASREETEKAAEHKIRGIREKYEMEMRDLERSEQQALDEMKARLTEVSGENECLLVKLNQKDQEIDNLQELTDKMHRERDRVSDIIRQEFADRLVATDEENKRVKNEMSEMKARHRIELERCKEQMEDVRKQKDEEMEEVHKRVKQTIVKKEKVVTQLREQYNSAQKRADHLEGLLQQQRKQLLGKK